MLFLGPKRRFDVWAKREVLIFIDNLLAKESKQRCSSILFKDLGRG
jgi:hypothetical protein